MLHSMGPSLGIALSLALLLVSSAVCLLSVRWSAAQGAALQRERLRLAELLRREPQGATEGFADRLEECSQRFERAIEPFAAGMERLTGELPVCVGTFSHRLDHASHTVLQAVEGMRSAAGELCAGTAGLDRCYARLDAMYQSFEPLAAQVASSHASQQEQLTEIAGGLHGITESLTTVVSSANESQSAIAGVANGIGEAVVTLQAAALRLEASVDRIVAALQASAAAALPPPVDVSLRCLVEQQQQFINILDQRLAVLDRHSSSSSSNSSSRSSSSISSSAAKTPPPRTLSNQAM